MFEEGVDPLLNILAKLDRASDSALLYLLGL